MLYKGMPNSFLAEAANNLGVDNPESLLDSIASTLIEVTFPQVDEKFVARQFAEICRAQSTYNHSGESVIAQRQTRSVFVSNSHETEKLLVNALTNSGIGFVGSEPKETYDFAVLVANLTLAPKSYSHWLNSLVPHLAIIFDNEGVTVTPVIETGKTPCLTCFHEQQVDRDSAWPEVASQLLFSEQKFDDATSRLFGAAIACQRALDCVDELGSFVVSDRNRVGYRLNIGTGTVSEYRWDFSSRCLCQQ